MTARDQALIIKGFLIGKEAPKPLIDAIDEVIGNLGVENIVQNAHAGFPAATSGESFVMDAKDLNLDATPKPRKNREWSEEARAAAADRMRARQAAGLMKRKDRSGEAHVLPARSTGSTAELSRT